MHLVAAHFFMAQSIIHVAMRDLNKIRNAPGWTTESKRQRYKLADDMPFPSAFFYAPIADIAQAYCGNLRDKTHGVVKYMHDRERRTDDDEVETAWWVLMLRGIAWDMSAIELTRGNVVPASLYNNSTPVWIT